MFNIMTAGQISDHTVAAALLKDLSKVRWLLGYLGNDVDWTRDALQAKGIQVHNSGRKPRTEPAKYDKHGCRCRRGIEIMSARLKPAVGDWRHVATRYDRFPAVFIFTIALAAVVIFSS